MLTICKVGLRDGTFEMETVQKQLQMETCSCSRSENTETIITQARRGLGKRREASFSSTKLADRPPGWSTGPSLGQLWGREQAGNFNINHALCNPKIDGSRIQTLDVHVRSTKQVNKGENLKHASNFYLFVLTHQTKDQSSTDQVQIFRFKYFVFFNFCKFCNLNKTSINTQALWNNKGGAVHNKVVAVHLTCLGRPREGEMDEIQPETGDYSQPIDSIPTLGMAPGARNRSTTQHWSNLLHLIRQPGFDFHLTFYLSFLSSAKASTPPIPASNVDGVKANLIRFCGERSERGVHFGSREALSHWISSGWAKAQLNQR